MDLGTRGAAANDTLYLPSRHRTLPILASITPIANYPTKLRIFKTNASRYWQVRCFLKGRTYTQSLKTTNKKAAISQAKHFFHIKTAELYGEHIRDRGERESKFADFVQAALAFQQGRVKRGELTASSLAILRNRLHKHILPFFGEMPVDKIGYQQVSQYIQRLSDGNMTTVTIQQHMVAVRKVLHYAVSVGKLTSVPKFPAVKVSSKPRGHFSVTEYRSLVQLARQHQGARVPMLVTERSRKAQGTIDRYGHVSEDLAWLIRFMVNSFIRPSDIKFLQHQHVAVIRGRHTYLRLNLPETKKHDKPIVTLQAAGALVIATRAFSRVHGLSANISQRNRPSCRSSDRLNRICRATWRPWSVGGRLTANDPKRHKKNSPAAELTPKRFSTAWRTAKQKVRLSPSQMALP